MTLDQDIDNVAAGDVTSGQAAPDGAVDMVPRTELERAIQRRQLALEDRRALETERDELRAALADAKRAAKDSKPVDTGNPTEAINDRQTLESSLADLQAKWKQREDAERNSAFESAILAGGDPSKASIARLVLRGLVSDGTITTGDDASSVRSSLAAKYPDVFNASMPANPRQSIERTHSHLQSPAEVERGDMGNVSSADWQRMIALGQGPRPLI